MKGSPFFTSSVAVVIPARWGSTRFPGKLLHPIAGRPLIQHVWERCSLTRSISRIIIAVDDERLAEVAQGFGAEVVMTSVDHQSGTDRIAEVAEVLKQQAPENAPTHFINVQGDEPLIDATLIDHLAETLLEDSEVEMVTAATPLEDPEHRNDPNIVKVVVGCSGNALYFSRNTMPYHRDPHDAESEVTPLLHLGIYGFRYETLQKFVTASPSPLEKCEKLEQLRALEHGIPIKVVITNHRALGVDTPEDARRIEAFIHGK